MLKNINICTIIIATILVMVSVGCSTNTANTTENATENATEIATGNATEIVSKAEDTADSNAITNFEDVNTDKVKLIALGNSDVPVGQYSQEVFTNLGFWDDIQSKISFGGNVKEVLSQVENASVDCGVVYKTDAATATGINIVCSVPEGSLETPVIYPAAMLAKSDNAEAAKVFLNFLLSDEAKAEFEKVGFKNVSDSAYSEISCDANTTLTVFAAASMKESLTAIQALFNKAYPNIELVFNFDSSGTLQKQIEQGAAADVFISAAQKQMKALTEGGYIDSESKIDLLENEVVLITPVK